MSNYRKCFIFMAFLCTAVFACVTLATYGDNIKIGIVNINYVIKNAVAFKNMTEQFSKKENEYMKDIEAKNLQLQKQYQELEAQKNVLSETEQEKKADVIARASQDLQAQYRKNAEALQNARIQSIETLTTVYKNVVSKVAVAEKFDIVIEEDVAPYSKADFAITEKVLKEFNNTMTKIDINLDNNKSKLPTDAERKVLNDCKAGDKTCSDVKKKANVGSTKKFTLGK